MRDERGFSLAEVLAALLILTFVITVSFTAFLERNNRLQQAGEIMLAYQALANEAEYKRRTPFQQLQTEPEFASDTSILAPLVPFHTAVVVTPVKPGVKNVTLRIRWNNNKREAKLELVRTFTGNDAENLW